MARRRTAAYYYDENGNIYTREQWIGVIQYTLEHGMFENYLDIFAPEGTRKKAAEMFEMQLKDGMLTYYGVMEVSNEL